VCKKGSTHSAHGKTFLSASSVSVSEGFEERILAAMQSIEEGMQSMQKNMTEELKEVKEKQDKTNNMLSFISKKVDAYTHCMGKPFEEFSRGVLSVMLLEEIDDVEKLKLNKSFKDPFGFVHKDKATLVEIDIFCQKPLIVVECKGLLSGDKGIEQLHTFIRKKHFVETLYEEEARGYLFSYTVDNDILQQVTGICESNGIRIVRSLPEASESLMKKEKK